MRYVDDVLAIFNSSTHIQLFLNVLNNQHLNLRFTCEKASGISLPFLDVEKTIGDREFDVSCTVFQLLPMYFNGNTYSGNGIAPLSWKRGLITCLLHRAYLYSLNES